MLLITLQESSSVNDAKGTKAGLYCIHYLPAKTAVNQLEHLSFKQESNSTVKNKALADYVALLLKGTQIHHLLSLTIFSHLLYFLTYYIFWKLLLYLMYRRPF